VLRRDSALGIVSIKQEGAFRGPLTGSSEGRKREIFTPPCSGKSVHLKKKRKK